MVKERMVKERMVKENTVKERTAKGSKANGSTGEGRAARTPIAALLSSHSAAEGVTAQGWVRTRRDSKDVTFVELNDGSCLANLQVVFDPGRPETQLPEAASTGASLIVSGRLVESPA